MIEPIRSLHKRFFARPTGVGRALATYDMPIEGRDQWLGPAAAVT